MIGNWHLTVCGVNYKTATLEEREPLQINQAAIAEAHATLVDYPEILEAIVVSTCNRIEFYMVVTREQKPFDLIRKFYNDTQNTDISPLRDKFYTKNNKHTADHLCRVVSGIDSMVLGENQVLGQVKEAYSSACAVKSAGKILHRLFHQAFRIGKQVRSDTKMGQGACSVSSAAIELLKVRLKEFRNPTFLFVGINQMISLAAIGLAKLDFSRFKFANRTEEKAIKFANRFQAEGYSLQKLDDLLAVSDICITCTGSSNPIITRAMIDAHPESFDKPLLVLDMAIPRDTDIETDRSKAVEVLNLNDIQSFVKNQQAKRADAIPQAEEIIEEKMNEFMYWYNHVRHEPLYNGLENKFEEIRLKEFSDVLKRLPSNLQDEVNRASKLLINKLIQVKMRTSAKPNDGE